MPDKHAPFVVKVPVRFPVLLLNCCERVDSCDLTIPSAFQAVMTARAHRVNQLTCVTMYKLPCARGILSSYSVKALTRL